MHKYVSFTQTEEVFANSYFMLRKVSLSILKGHNNCTVALHTFAK